MLERFFGDHNESLANAIQSRSLNKVKECIKNGADINNYDRKDTPLIQAIKIGDLDIIRYLVKSGANVNPIGDLRYHHSRTTPLMSAIIIGNHEIIEILLSAQANVNKADNYGQTPLSYAVMRNNHKVVTLLLNFSADINKFVINQNEYTPHPILFEAIAYADQEMVTLLLNKKADVNKADNKGRTPLIEAVHRGKPEMVTLLLNNGALVDYVDNQGESALFYASKKGDLNILTLLIDAKADITIQNKESRTALMIAKDNETRKHITELFKERNTSLKEKLKEFENAREESLYKDYISKDAAQKAAKEILKLTWESSANNAAFIRKNMDRLPIDYKNLGNVLFDLADLLTILNSKDLNPNEQKKFDEAARANRELAAALNHDAAKRIVEYNKRSAAVQVEKNESPDQNATFINESNTVSLTSPPCLFSSSQKSTKEDLTVALKEKDCLSSDSKAAQSSSTLRLSSSRKY